MPDRPASPYDITSIPKYIRTELERRKHNYGINYVDGYSTGSKGPMAPWVRVCSNGISSGSYGPEINGFIMYGSTGFANTYGFTNTNNVYTPAGSTVLGYGYNSQNNIVPHVLSNENVLNNKYYQKHATTPGVISVDASLERNLYRKATIKWKCNSVKHMEYLTPFFFTPGVTCIVEWGWNVYNNNVLIDLSDTGVFPKYSANTDPTGDNSWTQETSGSGLKGYYMNPTLLQNKIAQSGGNYEVVFGIVTDFDYTLQNDGTFECTTVISSNAKIYSGQWVNDNVPTNNTNKQGTESVGKSFGEFFKEDFHSKVNISSAWGTPVPLSSIRINRNKTSVGYNISPAALKIQQFNNGEVYKYDSGDNSYNGNKLYLTFGKLVDYINEFVVQKNKYDSQVQYFKINIDRVYIGAHPNIISTDGDILLIPNNQAPYISPDFVRNYSSNILNKVSSDDDTATSQKKAISIANKSLKKTFGYVKRQDLDSLINKNRYIFNSNSKVDFSFPQKNTPYEGRLKDLYISLNTVDRACSCKTLNEFLQSICDQLNQTVSGFWNLRVVMSGNTDISIIDEKHISPNQIKSSIASNSDSIIYYFDNLSVKNPIKSFGFSVKMSEQYAAMVISSNGSAPSDNQMAYTSNFLSPNRFDRLLRTNINDSAFVLNGNISPEIVRQSNGEMEDTSEIKNQLSEKDGDFMTVQTSLKPDVLGNLRLVMPVPQFLVYMINDDAPENVNVNCMPQPGTNVEIELDGIGGFTTFNVFGCRNLPSPYDKDVLFRIVDVKHSISSETWSTTLNTVITPVRELNLATG